MIAYSKCAVKFVYKDHSREPENVNNLKNETVVCYIEVFFIDSGLLYRGVLYRQWFVI